MPGFFVFSGAKLRAVRERVGLSREELALAAELAASSITVLENGYRGPSRAALIRLADALGVSPRELVDEDPAFSEAVAR
jgi:transcriptional regulator with XRE-family HTH domain